jgi:hypothetical protein
MRLRTHIAIGVAMAVLIPAGLLAQKVNRDYDKSYDFAKIKTFAIKIGTSWNNQMSENRALTEIATALTGKGWVRSANEQEANALVVIHGASETKKTLNTFYDGWGGWGYGGMGMGGSTTSVYEYQVGTLVVDIFDVQSKNLIFRSTASDELNSDPFKNEKKLQKAVEKMFKDFPPK